MDLVPVILAVLSTYFCIVRGQTACSPPGGGNGVCKSVYDCPMVLEILVKPNKTQHDLNILRNSGCGYQGKILKVCCPNPCYTPDGQPGRCVSILTCPRFANILQPPYSKETKQLVKRFTCRSTEKHSVCCADEAKVYVAAPGVCAANVSAFPPDPRTQCCGVDSNVGNKIVGGHQTAVEQYPWLVLIEYLQEGMITTACGGSLISGRYVVTAAHCVVGHVLDLIGNPVSVRLGEYDTRNNGRDCAPTEAGAIACTDGIEQIQIERIIPHLGFSSRVKRSTDDIALIRLARMAPFTDFIRPICLPNVDVTASPPVNLTLFVAGWGETNTSYSSHLKMDVDLPYAKQDRCEHKYTGDDGKDVLLTPKQICAGGVPGKDSCRGDSGGPLMYENGKTYEVIGVVSYGPKPCGQADIPGVYTKVFEYHGWINSNIQE